MKAVLLVIGAIALTMACLSAMMLVGMGTTGAVRDTLEALDLAEGETTTATASSGQKATAVCVGVLNWRNCNITQESTTEVNQPAQNPPDNAALGFVFFGMIFVAAGFIATVLTGWLWPSSEF
jgi:hypothetical protein